MSENPFASRAAVERATLADCIDFSVLLRDDAAFARVRNQCRINVAVLTSPAEVRIRRDRSERFPEPSQSIAGPAMFYVAADSIGLSGEMFMGDGGKMIFSPPGYAAVAAGTELVIPILGAERLRVNTAGGPGTAFVVTSAVPMASWQPHMEPFDLRVDSQAFNARGRNSSQEPFRLPRTAQEISARATFPPSK